ncbi:hypothetical protein FGO68_gene15125 [Halteria grandinella]|uniref:Uncharacterized protein n=1 Tax=Halteria grandinella TaxID=5974 RepID=A0A8J8TB59_HALGN|nr:hypothetical protein FGO68_gene15125 [Halteria grandinella]
MKLGYCQPEVIPSSQLVRELFVDGGPRGQLMASGHFTDILSALKYGYGLHRAEGVKKVVLYLATEVNHYVTPADFQANYPLIDEENQFNMDYMLYILQVNYALIIQ